MDLRTVVAVIALATFTPNVVLAQSAGRDGKPIPGTTTSWPRLVDAQSSLDAETVVHWAVPRRGRGPGPRGLASTITDRRNAGAASEAPLLKQNTAQTTRSAPASLSFQALADNNTSIPPDTHGSAGPSHLMTTLNTQVRVQDKLGNVLGTVSLATFWSALPSNTGVFDPRVLYDALHGRWITSCATNGETNNSKINFAISATSDPTGTWTYYQLPADTLEGGPACWADFPCLGFNGTWFVITANMFRVSDNGFQGARMWAINASSVLSGGSISYKLFPTSFDFAGGLNGFSLQACATYGAGDTLYIVDNSGYYASTDSTFLIRMSRLTGTAGNPLWSVVPGSSFSGSGLFRAPHNFNMTQVDATQQGTSTKIATGDSRVYSAIYRGGRIWCTHSGGLPAKIKPAPDRTAVFWYQLNPTAMPNPTVQSGQLDGGTGEHYFFPSIAANVVGDACVGFTRSDATRFAEAAFTGRLATDPSGTMQTIQQLKAGQSSYSKFFGGTENRWGDYSNTSVDPSDDLTFWTIQEYAAQNAGTGTNDGRWGTWWGKIETQSSLPIQLASLVATRAGSGAVHLEWTTLSEIDNYGFEVQRRGSVAIPFATIPNSFVPGSGTTIEPKRYRYDDISAGAGTSDYRLKQIDLNGAVHFSEPVAVAVAAGTGHAAGVPMESRLLQNYPNPFNPVTTIVYRVGGSEGLHEVRLEIFDVLGRRVATPVDERVAPGLHEVSFDASGLAGGVYLCRMSTDGWSGTIRLAVMR